MSTSASFSNASDYNHLYSYNLIDMRAVIYSMVITVLLIVFSQYMPNCTNLNENIHEHRPEAIKNVSIEMYMDWFYSVINPCGSVAKFTLQKRVLKYTSEHERVELLNQLGARARAFIPRN